MKHVFIIILALIVFYHAKSQIKMDSNGNVLIGSTEPIYPNYKLRVYGWTHFVNNMALGTAIPENGYALKVGGSSSFVGTSTFSNLTVTGSTKFASLAVTGSSSFSESAVFSKNVNIINFAGSAPALQIQSYSSSRGIFLAGSSEYLLYVDGPTWCTSGIWSGSDKRFKKNIKNIDRKTILSKLNNVSGHKYQYKNSKELAEYYSVDRKDSLNVMKKAPQFKTGEYYGLIAQELEPEFPELVTMDSITGMKAVNYDGMIPILLEAIKAQQETIEDLEEKYESLTSKSSVIKSSSKLGKNTENLIANPKTDELTVNTLSQNVPNPFSENTTISYYLNQDASEAMICIYNMNGNQLKCYPLSGNGNGSIVVSGGELTAGMYMYSLIANKQLIDTKRMILTE